MSNSLPGLVLADFLVMGMLPAVFFRRGNRWNAMWWITAAPFIASGRVMALARRGALAPAIDYRGAAAWLASGTAVACTVLSLALIAAAWWAHREPPALWHQDDDLPAALVTRGAYAHIRHPLYTAYLPALCAALLAVPHAVTAAALPCGWLLLDRTARREERRLAASPLGAEYGAYMRRSGRFWPVWRHAS